jgi:peroxiredoxin
MLTQPDISTANQLQTSNVKPQTFSAFSINLKKHSIMRQVILLLVFVFAGSIAFSQAKLTDSTVVRDTAGVICPPMVWKTMLMKGYSIKSVDPQDVHSEFVVYKLSDWQIEDRLARMPKPRESAYFKTGREISSFKTTDINGNKVDLKALEGKIIVMNFWFVDCHPCRVEIPELNKLVDSFKTSDQVVFIAVALDDKFQLEKFLKSIPFKYQVIDKGEFIAQQYGIRSFPTHVVIDTDKKIYFHTTGLAPNTIYWLKKSINELLAKRAS